MCFFIFGSSRSNERASGQTGAVAHPARLHWRVAQRTAARGSKCYPTTTYMTHKQTYLMKQT